VDIRRVVLDYGEDQAEAEDEKGKGSSQSHKNSPGKCLS
jgi:hypothetical protein